MLATELLKLLRDVVAGRDRLDAALHEAEVTLLAARGLAGDDALASLGDAGQREVPVQVEERRVWGVPVHRVSAPRMTRAVDARGASPASWGLAAAEAARHHEEALDVLLEIASRELYVEALGEEIQDTTRRINALEQLVAPRLEADAHRIALSLEERAREETVRLKRFKGKAARRAAAAPR